MSMMNLRPASKSYTVVGNGETSKQVATSAVIVRGVIITGQSTAAVVRIMNSRNGTIEAGASPNHYIVAANSGESVPCDIQHNFDQGLYIELEQGQGTPSEATVFYD